MIHVFMVVRIISAPWPISTSVTDPYLASSMEPWVVSHQTTPMLTQSRSLNGINCERVQFLFHSYGNLLLQEDNLTIFRVAVAFLLRFSSWKYNSYFPDISQRGGLECLDCVSCPI